MSEAAAHLDRADQALRAARLALGDDLRLDAVSRAYYAVFMPAMHYWQAQVRMRGRTGASWRRRGNSMRMRSDLNLCKASPACKAYGRKATTMSASH